MKTLEKIVPEKYRLNAHHWLILHGRYICSARRPRCPDCIIRDLCAYPDKTPPVDAPAAKPKPKTAAKPKPRGRPAA